MIDHVEIIYNCGNNNYIIDRKMWYDSPDLGSYEEWLVKNIVDFISFNSDYEIFPYEEYAIDFIIESVEDCARAYRLVTEVIYNLIFERIIHPDCEVPIVIKFS